MMETIQKEKWNTKNLAQRLGADATAAASAALLVAPIITMIDRAIIERASTNAPLTKSLTTQLKSLVFSPHTFLVSRPFRLICALYFSTYMTANALDTATTTMTSKPASTVTSGTPKFVATSAVNMSVCVYKDSQFAKLFSGAAGSSSTSKIPKLSYTLFALRDSLTIFASFNMPPLIAAKLSPYKEMLPLLLATESRRMNTAQFVTPAAMQIFSTPIHLLGLDVFNRQGRLGFGERWARVKRDWAVSCVARVGRIVPAFGVGGVVNGNVRRGLMEKLE